MAKSLDRGRAKRRNARYQSAVIDPGLPQVKDMTMQRRELHNPLISAITAMVEGCCDFSQMLQTGAI